MAYTFMPATAIIHAQPTEVAALVPAGGATRSTAPGRRILPL